MTTTISTITISSMLFFASLGSAALGWLMFLLSVFLILLVLVQRGKGGGLTGALGGPGGQSAFGSKAGDTFTLITAVSAIIWGFICAIAMYTLGVPPLTADDYDFEEEDTPSVTAPADAGEGTTAGAGGLSSISDLLSDDAEPSSPEGSGDAEMPSEGTPSAELTPAESTPAESTPAEPPADQASDADSAEGESAAEGASAEQPESSTSDAAGDADSASDDNANN